MNGSSNGTSIFLSGFIISFTYFFLKFIEMRFILKENKPLKTLLRDALIVYFSVIVGDFILKQSGTLQKITCSPTIFTNDPDF